MANTYTSKVGFAKPANNDSGWDTTLNADLDMIDALTPVGSLAVQLKEVPSASLNVKVAAGSYEKADGTIVSYAGTSSFAVTASGTRYLYLTDAGTLTDGASWPATAHVRLAVVVTGGSTITSITDARIPFRSCAANLNTVYLALAGGTLTGNLTMTAVNLVTDTTTGTKIGTGTTQKLGFWNVTPVVQPSGANQAAAASLTIQTLTDSTGGSVSTTLSAATNTASLTDSSGGTPSTTLAAISDTATKDAIASIAAQLATQRSLNTVLINAVASLASQCNKAGVDLAAIRTLTNQIRGDLVTIGLIKGSA